MGTVDETPHISDQEWRAYQAIPDQGYSHRHHINHLIETKLQAASGAHVEAFRLIRERIGMRDVPIHVAADIEQIICETGGEWPDE